MISNKLKHVLISQFSFVGLLFALLVGVTASAAPQLEGIEFWDERDEQSELVVDHSQWQELLDIYIDDQHASGVNRFDYKSVSKEDKKKLDTYLDYLQSLAPREMSPEVQFAYWVNLYNAKTVDYIVEGVQKNNITSIKQIRSKLVLPGPWKRNDLKIEGKKLSLDNIEHGILRPIWKDHRIHFAVNCASIGCPNLSKIAYTPENTESLLEIAEEQFLSHPRAVRVTEDAVILSSLFDWYGADFADGQVEFFDYISDFVDPDIAEFLLDEPAVKYEYDWKLNGK